MPERRVALRWQAAASAVVAVLAFAMYRSTLLPGLDFGDTASFQDAGGSIEITPRQAYPLYFFIGNLVVWLAGGEPAFGMNLASAICGALACGLLTWLAIDLAGSVVGGLAAGTLFAASYTFWSQAVIAEVYALHVLLVGASLVALLAWGRRPESIGRLTAFFAVYALGFGNHLMMVLLAPAAVVFIALVSPRGVRELVRPRVVALAAACAALGAMQYLWNLQSLYTNPVPPESLGEALRTFWFDVTKSDWRRTMVMGVHESALRARWSMYVFDVRQQFGAIGIALALAGWVFLAARYWRVAVTWLVGWIVAVAFAYTYNVGDAHVFFIPSHVFVALAAGVGIAAALRWTTSRTPLAVAVGAAVLALPAWRIYDTWPAVDRSGDRRPASIVAGLAGDLAPERAILVADLNWQIQNALDYYVRHTNPGLAYMRASDRLLTLPWVIEANLAIGRDVVLMPASARLVRQAYGNAWPLEPDRQPPALAERLGGLGPGTPYVIALLRPYNDVAFDRAEFDAAVARLTGGTATVPAGGVYTIMVGRVGRPPLLIRSERRPFRVRLPLDGLALDIRMESWLPPDTMRRAGFGHVVVNRRHALTLERGVSVVALAEDGQVSLATYASSLYAPQPRFRIRAARGT